MNDDGSLLQSHIKPADFGFFVSRSKEADLRNFFNELDLKLHNMICAFSTLAMWCGHNRPELHLQNKEILCACVCV